MSEVKSATEVLKQKYNIDTYIPAQIRNDGLNLNLYWIYDQSQKTIDLWQRARYQARCLRYHQDYWPLKYMLIDFFEEILLDPHLYATVQNRKALVLGTAWSIVDENGNADPVAKRFLAKKWFNDFQNYCLEAIFFGYSLVELDDIDGDGLIDTIHCVERRNVVPEFNAVRIRSTDYRGPDLNDFPSTILIDTKTLGLLQNACPQVIAKRTVDAAWTEHCEIFSTHMMIAKVDVNDTGAVSRLKNDLQNVGRERIAILSHDETLEFQEQSSSDTYKIYKEKIDLANAEISKLFMGQTMTSDSGSSYAQAGVHERTAQQIMEQDLQWVADHVNDMLIPKLIQLYNYPLKNRFFKWNDSRQADINDRIKMFDMLCKYFDVDPSVIEENFNVQVEPKLQMNPLTGEIDESGNEEALTDLPPQQSKSFKSSDAIDTTDGGTEN